MSVHHNIANDKCFKKTHLPGSKFKAEMKSQIHRIQRHIRGVSHVRHGESVPKRTQVKIGEYFFKFLGDHTIFLQNSNCIEYGIPRRGFKRK